MGSILSLLEKMALISDAVSGLSDSVGLTKLKCKLRNLIENKLDEKVRKITFLSASMNTLPFDSVLFHPPFI